MSSSRPPPSVRATAPSVPPAEPRPRSHPSFHAIQREDRATRLQMSVMLVLGLALVAAPLYLWRRPKKAEVAKESEQPAPSMQVLLPANAPPVPKVAGVQLGEIRVLSCRDARSAAEECDRVPALEQAFSKVILDAPQCLPDSAGGGTVQYVADVHFGRRKIVVTAPRDGRSIRNAKLLTTCVAGIRKSLESFAFDGVAHGHLRYRVAVMATYSAAPVSLAPSNVAPGSVLTGAPRL